MISTFDSKKVKSTISSCKSWFNAILREQKIMLSFPREEQIKFLNQILILLNNSVQISDVAKNLKDFGTKKEREVAAKMAQSIEDGLEMHLALEPYISKLAYESMAASSASDNLNAGVAAAIDALKINDAIKSKLFWTLLKPFIGIIVLLSVVAGFHSYVVPKLAGLHPMNRWPGFSLFMDSLGEFVGVYGFFVFQLLVMIVLIVLCSLPIFTGDYRKIVDNFLIYRQYRMTCATSMLTSLAASLRAGVVIKKAMRSILESSSPYVRDHLSEMLMRLERGDNKVGEILDTGLINEDQVHILKVLGNDSDLRKVVTSSAEIHKEKLLGEIQKISVWLRNSLVLASVIIGGSTVLAFVLVLVDLALNMKLR
ncbi:type II secretion system F family protein [Vibrio europaeus]|uniref:type II secretion system F family protein n=1 Tax=Vibrio europaeus TaxID=300876 RepID=UPI00233F0AB6|nr:type II secretion system F family protein [Vibrio europaeus]MDC5870271.1 type II secretion system F family protein [Vibrio europaeus]